MDHRPAADTRFHREALTLPQRADGVFLGARDRGGLIATSNNPSGTPPHRTNVIDYRGTADPLDNFDDIISVGGN